MYSSSPYASSADNIYMTPAVHHSSNFYPTVTDNLFHQYRLQGVSGYYPEYHHSASTAAAASYAVTNGFLPYDSYSLPPSATAAAAAAKEEKWQSAGPDAGNAKYYGAVTTAAHHDLSGVGGARATYAGYASPATPGQHQHASATAAAAAATASTATTLPAPVTAQVQSTARS